METIIKDASKIRVSRNMYLISIICFALIVVTTSFGNPVYFIQALCALGLSIVSLTILLITKNYKLPVYLTIVTSILVLFLGFLTDSFVNNQGDTFWIIVITLFCFYTVGKRAAIVYMLANITSMVVVKLMVINGVINLPFKALTDDFMSQSNFVLNLVSCAILFIYLVSKILKDYEQAQKDLIATNASLSNKEHEKSTMLREIHHRVKNNLQVIISLLRLQLFQLDVNNGHLEPFEDSINRITTMALIHEKMYQGDKINNLNVQEYVDDLASDLVRTYATSTKVSVSIQSDINPLKMDDLVPFSLILNELITNSIKHGFKNHKTGEISIKLCNTDIGFDLVYKDSGQWQENESKQSFGLELIDTLSGHFDGIYKKNVSDEGTEFVFNFTVY